MIIKDFGNDDNPLIDDFRKRMVDASKKLKDPSLCSEQEPMIGYPTTFLPLDFMNGIRISNTSLYEDVEYTYDAIGINEGTCNMIIGPTASAKTTMVIQAACSIAQRFPASIIIHEDVERATTKQRIRNISGWNSRMLDKKYIIRDKGITTESFEFRVMEHYKQKMELSISHPEIMFYNTGIIDEKGKMVKKMIPSIVILDSLPSLLPAELQIEAKDKGNMTAASVAKANTQMIKLLIPRLKEANIILFIINHINPKINTGFFPAAAQINYLKQDEQLPGGNAILYLANNIFKFTKDVNLTSDKEFGINGWKAKAQIIKSRSNRAGQIAPLVYNQEFGFDRYLSCYQMLKNAGLVKGSNWYYFEDLEGHKFQQKQLLEKLYEDEVMRRHMLSLTRIVGEQFLSGTSLTKEEDDKQNASYSDMEAEGNLLAQQILAGGFGNGLSIGL